MAEEKNTGKQEEHPRINVNYNNTEEDPEREGPEQTKQKKSGIISEKGMRHISRIIRLIWKGKTEDKHRQWYNKWPSDGNFIWH